MAFYCWSCYGRNDHETGPCAHCGKEVSPPAEATETQRLIWGIHHPDPDVAIICTRRLGTEGDRSAIPALRNAVDDPPDPYVAGEALRALLALSDPVDESALLMRLARTGPVLLRREAQRMLDEIGISSPGDSSP